MILQSYYSLFQFVTLLVLSLQSYCYKPADNIFIATLFILVFLNEVTIYISRYIPGKFVDCESFEKKRDILKMNNNVTLQAFPSFTSRIEAFKTAAV